ncbi:hypothetical protein [Anseongella ginsenosidimutans]|uniref:hypothetical protein n=1 Tax=Anseongella ginsenosidimutans TaxID=496056 RepID=UPI0011C72E2C|nr:hypothetical protein [Anseongella ginsenosidimutans]QEC53007.1 hypothetical protein FRZ59_12135 [Anseongella ginsenosidimutans]
MRNKTLLFFILVSVPFFLSAQQKEAIDTGTASGVIKDSVHNYVLPAATLAVYLESDTSLLNYQLSDKSGEFSYRNLPVGVPLLIVATYVGYTPLTRHFTIPAEAKKIDLGTLNMNMSENTLEEVVVIAEPPVRMNGDTLEFNADAFKLDPNAVVEDLMRKLPGVTVWGDGVITVNGRKVNSVLVEGKPFFGGNMKVATQNIPKAAVEKIQVYKKNENDDTRDSTMEVNIRLKEHMRKGYFGKTMAGYGSDTRYQADGSFNVFTPKTQVSLVGASNNVNKTAGSVDDFLDNSTFKGVGASVDHYPDFFRQGITRQHSGGVRITHDFLDHLMPAKTHEIQGEFLISQTSPVQNRKTRTMINTGNDAARIQNTSSASDSRSSRQHLSTRYDLGTKSRRFYIAPQLDIQDNRTLSFNESNISEAENSIETFSTALQDRTKRSNSLSFATGYLHNLDAGPAYQIDYYLSANNRDEDFRTKTRFSSLYDSAKNRYYNRIYHDRENEQLHVIEFRLQKLNQLLYQPEGNGFLFDLQADLHIERIEQDRIVNDIDSAAQSPGLNAYLSNKSLYRSVNFLPALVVQRSFSRSLHGRFQKTLTFKLDLKGQFFNQKNASLKEFQLFSKNAATLLPAASIVYRNQQFDTYDATYSLRYISSTSFPAVDQLVPW